MEQTHGFRRSCWGRVIAEIKHHDWIQVLLLSKFMNVASNRINILTILIALDKLLTEDNELLIVIEQISNLIPCKDVRTCILIQYRSQRSVISILKPLYQSKCCHLLVRRGWHIIYDCPLCCKKLILCNLTCISTTKLMEDCWVEPQAFLLKILIHGWLCSSLTAIHKAEKLLTSVKSNTIFLRPTFLQLIKDGRGKNTADEFRWQTQFLQSHILRVNLCIRIVILLLVSSITCQLCSATRAFLVFVTDQMPCICSVFHRVSRHNFVALNLIDSSVAFIWYSLVGQSKDYLLDVWLFVIVQTKVKHVAIIAIDGI